jgi:hypothetical protein
MSVDIKIPKGLEKLDKRTIKGIENGLIVTSDIIAKEIRKTKLYKDRTGFLRKSGHTTGKVKDFETEFKMDADYAGFVDDKVEFVKDTLKKTEGVGEKVVAESIRRELAK